MGLQAPGVMRLSGDCQDSVRLRGVWLKRWARNNSDSFRCPLRTTVDNGSASDTLSLLSDKSVMRLHPLLSISVLVLAVAAPSLAQTKRALLIGIDLYQPPNTVAKHPPGCRGGRCDVTEYPNLEGSLNDVAAMRDLLASPKFGFAPQNIAVITNPALPASPLPYVSVPANQTTREGMLAAMRKYLVDTPARGDVVVFYYAGHGSLRLNSKGTKLSMVVDGKTTHADSTLVPSDAWTGVDDVRDREMTRIFNSALDKGVQLTVILDSCHSGGLTRGVRIGPKPRERLLDYDPRDLNEAPDHLANGQPLPVPSERGALVFSAAQQDQTAKESPPPDTFPEAHGAFTAALINALEVLPADTPASVVYRQVRATLEGADIEDQEPSLDAAAQRRDQPLFGGVADTPGKLRVAVIGSNSGYVVLDTGRLAGVGPGSTFVSLAATAGGRKITLKVKELDGVARSKASVLSPPGAAVSTGQVFELDKWVPAPLDPLQVWTWPSNLSEADIQAAAAQVQSAGITSVEDPASDPWTDLVSWDGSQWVLQHAGSSSSVALGGKLAADALRQHLAAGAKVWVNLPPPQELAAKLDLHNPTSLVQGAAGVADAEYVLAGSLTSDGPSWAWFDRAEFQKGPPTSRSASPGCSSTSHYPLRSDWVLLADASVADDAAKVLNQSALRLAKLNGWLHLPSSPGASSNYYHLAFMRSDNTLLADGQAVHPGDTPQMVLVSAAPVQENRWVYVLDVDCRGKGVLLYPRDYSENRFPNDANSERKIVLPGAPVINVQEPFGLDTIFFITTTEPLPDPWSLEFEGVSTRGVEKPPTPLQQLLSGASSGTRGLAPTLPTDWSISMGQLVSAPK